MLILFFAQLGPSIPCHAIAYLFITCATPIMAVHSHRCAFLRISVADQTAAALIYAVAERRLADQCHRRATPCQPQLRTAIATRCVTLLSNSMPLHCSSMRFYSIAMLCTSMPLLCEAVLIPATAYLIKALHCHAFPLPWLCSSRPVIAVPNYALAFLFIAFLFIAFPPLRRSMQTCPKQCPCSSMRFYSILNNALASSELRHFRRTVVGVLEIASIQHAPLLFRGFVSDRLK